jgi:hypothetical protein
MIVFALAQWLWIILENIKKPAPVTPTEKQGELSIIDQLTKKINNNGKVWIVIGIIQTVASILWFGDILRRMQIWWFIPFLIILEGIKNITRGFKDIKFSERLWHTPTNIVKRYKTPAAAVEAFIDNIIFGGIIGLIGCIMLQNSRSFVKKNLGEFEQIENDFIREQNKYR